MNRNISSRILSAAVIYFLLALFPALGNGMPDNIIHKYKEDRNAFYSGMIVPGRGVGILTFDVTEDALLAVLGRPDRIYYNDNEYTILNLPEKYYFLYSRAGLSVLFYRGKIQEIVVLSPVYAMENGLKVGVFYRDVIEKLGLKYIKTEKGESEYYYYPDIWIQFEINKKDRMVWSITLKKKSVF